MGRREQNRDRFACRVSPLVKQILEKDAIEKGYAYSDGRPAFGEYLEALATGIFTQEIKIPKKGTDATDKENND
ncbi:MAG: hypothetical protein J7647_22035 [Cyanobacteria bacterium SBLK]|nr:hypothetical protein [Cyanobacteria bacterium SBLK]